MFCQILFEELHKVCAACSAHMVHDLYYHTRAMSTNPQFTVQLDLRVWGKVLWMGYRPDFSTCIDLEQQNQTWWRDVKNAELAWNSKAWAQIATLCRFKSGYLHHWLCWSWSCLNCLSHGQCSTTKLVMANYKATDIGTFTWNLKWTVSSYLC